MQKTSYAWARGELPGIVRSGQFYASHNDQLGRPEGKADLYAEMQKLSG